MLHLCNSDALGLNMSELGLMLANCTLSERLTQLLIPEAKLIAACTTQLSTSAHHTYTRPG